MTDSTPLAEQRCVNCGSTELRQDTNGVWHCQYCRSTFRADDPAMIVVASPNVQQANENVIDTADLLTFDQQEAVSAHLRALRDRTDVVVVVETVNTITENVSHYARRRAQELGIGDDAKDNGVLVLMVREPRRVQVQTGNGVARFLGSDDVDRIVKEAFVPRFTAGDLVAGLTAGADALVAEYQDNRATGRVRQSESRASGEPAAGARSRSSRPSGSPYRERPSLSSYRSYRSATEPRQPSIGARIFWGLVVFVAVWFLLSALSGRSPLGLLGGGGGGSSYDSGSDWSWDSGGGGGSDWDSGGGSDGGGSDFGGGDFDSGSGGGSDW